MSDLKKKFGKRLKELREERGLSQEKLAELAEVHLDTISNIERGIHGPRFDLLAKLSRILNQSVNELFTFK